MIDGLKELLQLEAAGDDELERMIDSQRNPSN